MAAQSYIEMGGRINSDSDNTKSLVEQFGHMSVNTKNSTSDINDSFEIVIPSGPTFRSLCVFFEETCSSGHFIVMSEGMIFSQYQNKTSPSDEDDLVLNRAEIFSCELPIFKFNSSSGTYAFHISPSLFKNRLGKIPQKAEILLRKESGNRDIEITILNHTSGTVVYSPIVQDYNNYEIEDDESIKPLCVVRTTDFSNTIAHMISNQIFYVVVYPKDNKLCCSGYEKIGTYVGTWSFSGEAPKMETSRSKFQLNIVDKKEFKIGLSLLRILPTLSQLNKKSCVRFYAYYSNDGTFNRLKLVSHIGSYGYLSTYIR